MFCVYQYTHLTQKLFDSKVPAHKCLVDTIPTQHASIDIAIMKHPPLSKIQIFITCFCHCDWFTFLEYCLASVGNIIDVIENLFKIFNSYRHFRVHMSNFVVVNVLANYLAKLGSRALGWIQITKITTSVSCIYMWATLKGLLNYHYLIWLKTSQLQNN